MNENQKPVSGIDPKTGFYYSASPTTVKRSLICSPFSASSTTAMA
ncbi:hypothetical protein B4123_3579 [Bacillus paralicheniformis]|uniref:Uncharacterized protein n=1 Tax=Bacillus paralicheniformis TaxID=1648923 RepID=A0A7Z0X0B3_9BACI|nr:hypothetical protein B4121_1636 [Bacillus paralicheniformis]OLG09143.1 hypothetical protein B4123_3579 [Bacillus paralicheniformis]TWJ79670.1 hypothetical protein CHCC4186_2742 [Bacillus paralicheniformis]TWN46457.1 hypothetical protein CHCC14523_1872 [Bacillus paralicheniformis]TWN87375.1 hypothetical protein CHCC20492_3143 [Bacillus paralicheniformis]